MTNNLNKGGINLSGVILTLYTLFLIKLMTGSIIPVNLYLISVIVLTFALTHFFLVIREFKAITGSGPFLFWYFMLYCIISLIWTRDLQYGTQKLFILLSIVVISSLISHLIIKRTKAFIDLFSLGSLLILIWYLSVNGFNRIDLGSQDFRLDLKEGLNPIIIARYFCFAILTLLFYLRYRKMNKIFRFFIAGIIILLLFLVFLTGSKGPVIALILSIVLPYAIGKKFRFKAKSIFLGAIGVLFLLCAVLLLLQKSDSSAVFGFIERRYWGADASASVSGRIVYLNVAFDQIINQPISSLVLGNGMGDFGYVYSSNFQANYPHNIFVELLYETGLLGFLIFTFLIYKVVCINVKWGKRLFFRRYASAGLYYFLSLFYLSFLAAMTSGDIAGNFFVFVSILFIFRADREVKGNIVYKQRKGRLSEILYCDDQRGVD